jgi:hypothetical protein
MDGLDGALFFQLPVFLVAAAVVAVTAWYHNGAALPQQSRATGSGRLRLRLPWATALIGVWFLLTVLSAWTIFLVGSVVCHVLLFLVGPAAAAIGIVALGLTLISLPFLWGWAIFTPAFR